MCGFQPDGNPLGESWINIFKSVSNIKQMEVHGGVDDGHEKQGDRYTITRFANDSRGVYKIHVTKSKSVF